MVPVRIGSNRRVMPEDAQLSALNVRCEHRFDHGQCDAWFAPDARYPAVAGIEAGIGLGLRNERRLRAIVVAHAGSQRQVAACATDGLDPRILVGRYRLLGELSADPIGFLGHDHAEPTTRGGQRGGAASETAADDHEIGGQFVGMLTRSVWSTRDTTRRRPHERRDDGQPFEKVASADIVNRFPLTGHVLTNVGAERS